MYTVHIQVSQKVLKLILCPHKVGSVGRSARKPLTNCGERGLFAGRIGECWLKFGREDVRSSHGRSSPRPKTPHAVAGHGGPHLPPYFRPHLPSTPHPPHQSSHLFPPKNPPLLLQICGSFGRFGRCVWARTLVGVHGSGGRTMAKAGESQRQLDETPTWAVASVCAVIVLMSILLELVLHRVGEVNEGDSLTLFLFLDFLLC